MLNSLKTFTGNGASSQTSLSFDITTDISLATAQISIGGIFKFLSFYILFPRKIVLYKPEILFFPH